MCIAIEKSLLLHDEQSEYALDAHYIMSMHWYVQRWWLLSIQLRLRAMDCRLTAHSWDRFKASDCPSEANKVFYGHFIQEVTSYFPHDRRLHIWQLPNATPSHEQTVTSFFLNTYLLFIDFLRAKKMALGQVHQNDFCWLTCSGCHLSNQEVTTYWEIGIEARSPRFGKCMWNRVRVRHCSNFSQLSSFSPS